MLDPIRCPECGQEQVAEIEFTHCGHGVVVGDYVHKCVRCGYLITESEWEFVCEDCGASGAATR